MSAPVGKTGLADRKALLEPDPEHLRVRRQGELLKLKRSSVAAQPVLVSEAEATQLDEMKV